MAELAEQPTADAAAHRQAGRSLRHGDLRRRRRSHRAHAHPRALQPGARRTALPRLRRGRRRPHPDVERRLPQARPRRRQSLLRRMRRRRTLGVVRRALLLFRRRLRRRQALSRSSKTFSTKVDQDHSAHGNFFYYLATAPSFFGPIVAETRRRRTDGAGERPLAARDHRKALRTRSRIGQSAQPATAQSSRRKPDLPHRPLPRQRNRPEHHGVPLRQRNLRARSGTAATSTTCRSPSPRPSASKAAAATTITPARCATWCRTTSCSSSASPPWSRRFPSTPTRCATSRPRFCTPSSP